MPVKDREQQKNLLQHFQEVSRLALAGDYENLADYVAEAVNDLTGASVALWMMSEKENVLRIQAGRGLRREHMENGITPVEPGRSITSIALRDGRPVFRSNILDEIEEPRFYNLEEAKRQGWHSFLSVPLLGQAGQPLGALSIYYTEQRDSSEPDQSLLSTFANQIAIAFENVRTREHSRQQSDALRNIVGTIGAKADPLPLILEEAIKLFGAEYGSFSLVDPEAGQLTYQAILEKGEMLVGEQIPKHKRVRDWEKGVTGYVARTGRVHRTGNVTEDPYYERWYGATVSELAVPLKDTDGKTIGVLNLESPVWDAFSQAEEDLCQYLANVAATAIEKAQLFETMQRLNAHLESLHQVIQEQSLEEVLDRILEGINTILGEGTSSSINLYEEKTDSFYKYRAGGSLKDYLLQVPPRPDGTGRHVLRTGEPLYLDDVHNPPPGCPTIRDESIARGVRSFAVLPLKRQEQIVGVLFVNLQRSISFTEDLKRILRLFASQTAVAIENSRLFQELDDRAARLVRLQEVTATISAEPSDLEKVLRLVLESLSAIFQRAPCAIRLYDSETDEFGRRISAEAPTEQLVYTPRPNGVSHYVVKTRAPFYVEDTSATLPGGQPAIREELKKEGVKTVANLPLLSKGDIIGILYVDLMASHQFSQNEKRLLELFANQAAIAIENARLYEQRSKDIAALQEVNEAVVSKELDEILQLVVEKAVEVMPGKYGELWLKEQDTSDLVLQTVCGPAETAAREIRRLKAGVASINMQVAEKGEPYICKNVQEETRFYPIYKEARSSVTVPLKYRGEAIGTLNVESPSLGAFTGQHSQLLYSFADQAAIAIENARLFDSAQRRIQDLEIVNDVVEIISTKLDTEDLLHTIASQIADKLNCTHCTLFFPEKENGELLLVPRVTYGMLSEQIMRRRFKLDEGLAGWVFQHGESLALPNAKEDPRFASATAERDQPRSMLVAPIKIGDQPIGVISADKDEYGWFGESERRLADALARQAGIAIERARGLELLQDIGNRIISAQKVDEILQHILTGAIKLTNTTSGVIHLISEEDGKPVSRSVPYPPDFDHPATRLDSEESITREVIATGKLQVLPDIKLINPALYNRGIQSMIAVPLKVEEQVIGVLYLNDEDPHHFTDTEVSLLSTLANQAATVIQNAERRVQDISALTEVNRAILREDRQKVTQLIADNAVELTGAAYCVLRLVDSSGQYLEPEASSGRESKQDPLPIDATSFTGWVASQGKAELCSDVSQATHYLKWYDDVKSCMAAPLLHKEQLIGTLYVESIRLGAFSEESQLDLLQSFADQAAVAIENARLFDQLQEELQRTEVLSRLGDNLAALEQEF